ncbi:MAG TPA: FAD/NAD(P)-binding oxidoreductase [Bacteroidia bacterium]|nr:FAD/NAD(P)-binding oxidoreductase [Bacteroidia bacterium]
MHYQVLIVGGGTAGIMTAAQLRLADSALTIAIVDPALYHYYQPAWTLVAAEAYNFEDTRHYESEIIPDGVVHIKDAAVKFDPDRNKVELASGLIYTYDVLVVCPGIKLDIDGLPGLREALATDKVCSNYINPNKSLKVLREFQGGNAVFSQPSTPIKCGGAPQKAAYLADDFFRKYNIRTRTNLFLTMPGSVVFGMTEYRKTLEEVIKRKEILFMPQLTPVKIDSNNQEIHFRISSTDTSSKQKYIDNGFSDSGEGTLKLHYDMLHIAPPQSAPDVIKASPFAYATGPNAGWMEVDIHTLQHPVFKNVFGLGDTAALPTAKTGAAVRKQAPVVTANVIEWLKSGRLSHKKYEGYSSCPIVTGYGKMMLAEFKYNNVRDTDPLLGKFFDTTKELYSMWLLKKYVLPWLYWHRMLKGKM